MSQTLRCKGVKFPVKVGRPHTPWPAGLRVEGSRAGLGTMQSCQQWLGLHSVFIFSLFLWGLCCFPQRNKTNSYWRPTFHVDQRGTWACREEEAPCGEGIPNSPAWLWLYNLPDSPQGSQASSALSITSFSLCKTGETSYVPTQITDGGARPAPTPSSKPAAPAACIRRRERG